MFCIPFVRCRQDNSYFSPTRSPNDPHDAAQPVAEKIEWDRIQAAQCFFDTNQSNECLQACNIIHSDEECSLYGKTAAKLMTLGIKWNLPEYTTIEKMRELQEMGNLINEIKGWGMKRSNETAWGHACDQWLRMVFYCECSRPSRKAIDGLWDRGFSIII